MAGSPSSFILHAILALIFAIIIEWLLAPVRRMYRAVRLWYVEHLAASALREIKHRLAQDDDRYPDADLESIFRQASPGDSIIIVGRTNVRLLAPKNHAMFLRALRAGATIQILLLDGNTLAGLDRSKHISIGSLGIPDARWLLANDLRSAEAQIRSIRRNCRRDQVPGSLLVYRTVTIVHNSAVIHVPQDDHAMRRMHHDHSFGDREKYVHIYRYSRAHLFCNALQQSYQRMFGGATRALDLCYEPLDREATEDRAVSSIRDFMKREAECEPIRNNTLFDVVRTRPGLFAELDSLVASPPVSVQLELTNACSTACRHCFRWKGRNEHLAANQRSERPLSSLIDELAEYGVRTVTFSGGEPTQHVSFQGLLQQAHQRGMAVGILSNGVGVTEAAMDSIVKHADWLRLSIDGPSEEVYGSVRTSLLHQDTGMSRGAFDAVRETIRQFRVRARDFKTTCKLSICYTIQRTNVKYVPEMIDWVRTMTGDHDARALTLKFAHGVGDFLCDEDQIKSLYDVCMDPRYARAANLQYLSWYMHRRATPAELARGRPTEILYSEERIRCFTPFLYALVDPTGEVYPCCFLFEDNDDYRLEIQEARKTQSLGNVFERGFQEIWNGHAYRQIRARLTSIASDKRLQFKACGECTRHCNHNIGLSIVEEELAHVRSKGGDSENVLDRAVKAKGAPPLWL